MKTRTAFLIVIGIVVSSISFGTELPLSRKKVLDAEAYARWSWIDDPTISDDGKWVAYTQVRPSGTAEVVVRSTRDRTEFRASRGRVSSAIFQGMDGPHGFSAVRFSSDARVVLFTSMAVDPVIDEAPGVGILKIPEGTVEKIQRVAGFTMPYGGRQYIGYFAEPESAITESSSTPKMLVIRDLLTGQELQIKDVGEYLFDDAGRYVAYTLVTGDARSGVYSRRLSDGEITKIWSGAGEYRGLTLDPSGTQLAFFSDEAEWGHPAPRYSLYYSPSLASAAQVAVAAVSIEDGLQLSPKEPLRFVRSGRAVSFGLVTAPRVEAYSNSVSLDSMGQSHVELLHWKQDLPSPKALACNGYSMGAYQIASRHWVKLSDAGASLLLLGEDGRHAVSVYLDRLRSSWDVRTIDVNVIDALTGGRHLFRQGLQPQDQWTPKWSPLPHGCGTDLPLLTLSATGRYLIYFADFRWWSLDLQNETLVDLSKSLPPALRVKDVSVSGWQVSPRIFGLALGFQVAGWTQNDRRVLLYIGPDIWEFDPSGYEPARNLTHGIGEKEGVILRFLQDGRRLLHGPFGWKVFDERPEGFVDLTQPQLLAGMDQKTMSMGLWRMSSGAVTAPRSVVRVDGILVPVAKARRSGDYLFTRQSFGEFPDLWVGSRFDRLKRISDANPQQRQYRWGSSLVIDYTSDFGVPLKGLLYRPDGFDPTHKYPMIVGIYEMSSSQRHLYENPQFSYGAVSYTAGWPAAVSRGYLYFVPDVLSAAPYPAQSAVAAVLPAVQAVLDRGYADPHRIVLSGHSFGGYEAQYILTQSSLFKCVVSSAGLSNSIYAGLGSSSINLFPVEHGPLRQGGAFWERPFVYFANSSSFAADHAAKPILIQKNDRDLWSAVQGRDFFRSLRRNGEEVYMLNYPDEGHVMTRRINQMDWDTRYFEFLDYCLKDGPMPSWIQTSTPKPRSAGSADQD